VQWIDSLGIALALFFVLEGLLPFVSPSRWRHWFSQVMQMRDGQIRFFGLLSMLIGLAILLLL
jgi:uncharacterized protein YjeT (DUF2065 family)